MNPIVIVLIIAVIIVAILFYFINTSSSSAISETVPALEEKIASEGTHLTTPNFTCDAVPCLPVPCERTEFKCPQPEPCPAPEPCPVQKPCPVCPIPEPCPVQEPCPVCPIPEPCPIPPTYIYPSGRYIFIELLTGIIDHNPALMQGELQVFNKDDQNIALNKTVTMSSVQPSGNWAAQNLVDGNIGSIAHTQLDSNAEHWILVDLGVITEVSKILLYSRNSFTEFKPRYRIFLVTDKPEPGTNVVPGAEVNGIGVSWWSYDRRDGTTSLSEFLLPPRKE